MGWVAQHPGRDHRRLPGAGGGVVDGVVKQIAHQFLQQGGVALDLAAGCSRFSAFIAEVNLFFDGAGHTIPHHRHGQFGQITGLAWHRRATALGPRQRQQLVHGMGGANAGAANLAQRLFEFVGISTFALSQIGLHAQACQRGFELVRRIGQKALLCGNRVLQAKQQIVHRVHQRCHLKGRGLRIDRAEVVGFTGPDAFLQHVQGLDRLHQRQPDQQHRDGQNHKLREHHPLDDLGGQH